LNKKENMIDLRVSLISVLTSVRPRFLYAGMVRLPGDYRYSSYRHNATGKPDSLLTTHPVYQSLATTQEQRLAAYRALFADEIAPELLELVRNTTNACQVLGNGEFKDQIEAMLGRSVRPGKSGRPPKHRH
jgi:putative transposase